jgi:hypothetical protein
MIYNFWHKSFCLKQQQHFKMAFLNKIAIFLTSSIYQYMYDGLKKILIK